MTRLTLFALLLLAAQRSVAAPVQVLGFQFSNAAIRLAGYRFTHVETGANHTFGVDGRTTLDMPVGSNVTLSFPSQGKFQQTMGPTVMVPPEGMTTEATEYVMQVPSTLIYDFFNLVTPGHKNDQFCQFVVTVTGPNRTWNSFPQGIPGAVVTMSPPPTGRIFYFGVWKVPPDNHTNPFPNNRTTTSWDGGVLLENVPVAPGRPYVVRAALAGYAFTETVMRCDAPGLFVNGAPNQGPRATPDGSPRKPSAA